MFKKEEEMKMNYMFLELEKGEQYVLGETFVSPNSGVLINGTPFINPDYGVIFLLDREKKSVIVVHNKDIDIDAIEKTVISKNLTVVTIKDGWDFSINGKVFIVKDGKILSTEE